jgi:hypothetical protein
LRPPRPCFTVRYKRRINDPRDPGTPLAELKVKPGRWLHSQRFGEVHVAKSWGLTPSQYRALPLEDRAEMAAYLKTWEKMETYETEQAQKRAKAKERRNKDKPED